MNDVNECVKKVILDICPSEVTRRPLAETVLLSHLSVLVALAVYIPRTSGLEFSVENLRAENLNL